MDGSEIGLRHAGLVTGAGAGCVGISRAACRRAISTSVRWYAVGVHARQEKAGAAELERRGFEVFLPLRRERRPWSDRVKTVELALFPGYLFVRMAMSPER